MPPTSPAGAALMWFRRDLRCFDHAALYRALKAHRAVYCAFVFDTDILAALPSRADRRVEFIRAALVELDAGLEQAGRAAGGSGGGLIVRHGRAVEEIPRLAQTLGVAAVYANRDYEPAARARDAAVAGALRACGIAFHAYKDQVIFDTDEVLTGAGRPYGVFTPYSKAWLQHLSPFYLQAYPVGRYAAALVRAPDAGAIPTLEAIGFQPTDLERIALPTGMGGGERLLADFLDRIGLYARDRDFPARKGVSYLSAHLRFGTVSIRTLARAAAARIDAGAQTWLKELIWREFYQMVLWHRPDLVDHAFRPACDALQWDVRPDLFAVWCEGRTGYPIVDAAMRQLLACGWMHNRLRMIAASFLSKDLGIDWRQGEAFFARHLLDYDLAANNGGWQWSASTGCDAQPWFRIFNPVAQGQKFDPDGSFVRRYVPELARVPARAIHAPWLMDRADQAACGVHIGLDYPAPIVDHAAARQRTLARFEAVRGAA